MKHPRTAHWLKALACLFAISATGVMAQAQAKSDGSGVGTSGTSVPAATTVSPPKRDHAVSDRASAAITSGFTYNPAPPPKPVEDEDEVDLRDVDKPRNEIVRLPKYTVVAQKPPVFNDRSLYTADNLKKLAVTKYLTSLDTKMLNRWTVPGLGMSNEDRAMTQYLADERLANMQATTQQISMLRAAGDDTKADQVQSQYYDMFLRRSDEVHTDTLSRQQGK